MGSLAGRCRPKSARMRQVELRACPSVSTTGGNSPHVVSSALVDGILGGRPLLPHSRAKIGWTELECLSWHRRTHHVYESSGMRQGRNHLPREHLTPRRNRQPSCPSRGEVYLEPALLRSTGGSGLGKSIPHHWRIVGLDWTPRQP